MTRTLFFHDVVDPGQAFPQADVFRAYVLAASAAHAHRAPVDLLGIDEKEVDTNTIQKCLRETANIIAGSFLLGFEGEKSRNVTLPSMNKEDVFAAVNISDRLEITLSFNGYGVSATLETVDTVQ